MFVKWSISCAVLFVVFSVVLSQQKSLEEAAKCAKEKCDLAKENEVVKKGESICAMDDKGNTVGAPKCTAECMGLTIPEDQKKCFCDTCKEKNHFFCKEPGAKHVTEEECATTVCEGSGGVKWFPDDCE